MRSTVIISGLICLLAFQPAFGQSTHSVSDQSAHIKTWERVLADEKGLVSHVKELTEALLAKKPEAITAQSRTGKLMLLMPALPNNRGLFAHSHARALLAEYLKSKPPLDLRVSLARINEARDQVQVVLEFMSGDGPGGRPHMQRIVAVYRRTDENWSLSELRCP